VEELDAKDLSSDRELMMMMIYLNILNHALR
jgi:hypothetical protein